MILCATCDAPIPSDDPRFNEPNLPMGWMMCSKHDENKSETPLWMFTR